MIRENPAPFYEWLKGKFLWSTRDGLGGKDAGTFAAGQSKKERFTEKKKEAQRQMVNRG